jgi:DNA-binding response OmpR family regulator
MEEQDNLIPMLIAQTGNSSGHRWTLDREEVILGRGPGCDYVIQDRQVSRQHARIRKHFNGYMLEDLNSKNGTYVNGVAIKEPVLLQDGDVIQIALALKILFVGSEATIPLSLSDAAQMGLGLLRMDREAHRVWIGKKELDPPLSLPQFRLLHLLYSNAGRVLSRQEIVEEVWPDSLAEGVSEQAIDALVRRLRERLSELDAEHVYVVTVRGHGFRLENPI